jgi:hypothetical protein
MLVDEKLHSSGILWHVTIKYVPDFLSYCSFKTSTADYPEIYSNSSRSHSQVNQLVLTLSYPTSDLVRQYYFSVLLRCRKKSDTVFVAFVRPLSEPVRRFSSCSTDFSQQIAQVVFFLFLCVFLF